jgi:lipopolysaccharide transport system permease protein
MVANESMIKKVYFPKIILPLSTIVTFLFDFVINFLLLIIIAVILGHIPNLWIVIILPFSVIVTGCTIAGISLFLSSLNVKYRDVRNVLPFLIQIILFLTPVIYPLSIVSERNKYIMSLNPMTSVIEAMRMTFQNNPVFHPILIFISLFSALLILYFGLWYFQKTERYFADIV